VFAEFGPELANPELTVIAESGDGCMYGDNHFLAAFIRGAPTVRCLLSCFSRRKHQQS
jgi:hypothetical protein